jgi:hypothetical protein
MTSCTRVCMACTCQRSSGCCDRLIVCMNPFLEKVRAWITQAHICDQKARLNDSRCTDDTDPEEFHHILYDYMLTNTLWKHGCLCHKQHRQTQEPEPPLHWRRGPGTGSLSKIVREIRARLFAGSMLSMPCRPACALLPRFACPHRAGHHTHSQKHAYRYRDGYVPAFMPNRQTLSAVDKPYCSGGTANVARFEQ